MKKQEGNKNLISAIIKKLSETRDVYKSEGLFFKQRAYDKTINNLNNLNNLNKYMINSYEDILNYNTYNNNKVFTPNMLLKFKEISDDIVISQLLNVYGIGPAKARNLVDIHKVVSIKDLKDKSSLDTKLLTASQKIGFYCYEDLLERIPRREMLKHKKVLKGNSDFDYKMKIVGSFRRKKETSGDIDVMLITNIEEFEEYIQYLVDLGYLKYILAKGTKKMLGVCKLPGENKFRRLDLIRNSEEEFPYTLLYFTGSGEFNIAFRKHCLKMGLSLNENSFSPKVHGLKTEEDIFKHVGLVYVKPEDRIDLRSIKLLK